MTRAKVDPSKRQRIAHACDSCKRRKQKCTGQQPCGMCSKRRLDCTYSPPGHTNNVSAQLTEPPAKRPRSDGPSDALPPAWDSYQPSTTLSTSLLDWQSWLPTQVSIAYYTQPLEADDEPTTPDRERSPSVDSQDEIQNDKESRDSVWGARQLKMSSGEQDEDDQEEQHLHIGESAILAFLQMVRSRFEWVVGGQSEFTDDSSRFTFLEKKIYVPPDVTYIPGMPEWSVIETLVESFLVNTVGVIDLFDKRPFSESLEYMALNPKDVNRWFLSKVFLVLSIGLLMSSPGQSTHREGLLSSMYAKKELYVESFYKHGMDLAGDIQSANPSISRIEILLLSAVWKIAACRRLAAHGTLGIAIDWAYALGLHVQGDDEIYIPANRHRRRRLWKSLVIFDGFLGFAGLGRPLKISEDPCPSTRYCGQMAIECTECLTPTPISNFRRESTQAAAKTAKLLGQVLRKLYGPRKLSLRRAQDLLPQFKDWNSSLHASLHWRQLKNESLVPIQSIAVLNINLLQLNAIILLTRPFYLYHVVFSLPAARYSELRYFRGPPGLKNLSRSCLDAAYHIMYITNAAMEKNLVSQCNPFIIHPLFTAILIALTNEFAPVHHVPDADIAFKKARMALSYCAEGDFQAARYLDIVDRFRRSIDEKLSSSQAMLVAPVIKFTVIMVEHDKGCDPMQTLSIESPLPILEIEEFDQTFLEYLSPDAQLAEILPTTPLPEDLPSLAETTSINWWELFMVDPQLAAYLQYSRQQSDADFQFGWGIFTCDLPGGAPSKPSSVQNYPYSGQSWDEEYLTGALRGESHGSITAS